MRILIVDDIIMMQKLIYHLLAKHGKCDFASTGIEAVDKFAEALNTNEPYDLLCLDIMMPEMNGLQVLKRIREIEKESGVEESKRSKIIVLSAVNDSKREKEAYKGGCDSYLSKPLKREKLMNEIMKLGLIK